MSPIPPRRPIRRRGPNPRLDSDRFALAVDVLTALACLPTTIAVVELVANLGWSEQPLRPVLVALERSDLVETWNDPDHFGSERVMLSTIALARLGLRVGSGGDRWKSRFATPPGGAPALLPWMTTTTTEGD
jgi:hypothetical protein